MPPEMGKPKTIDLRKGAYAVVVDVGKSFKTKAQEGSDALGNLISSAPEIYGPTLSDIWMGFQDFPGHQEAAKRMKKMLPPPLQDHGEGDNDPEIVKQQRDQAGQMVEQLTQQLKQLQQVIETDQVKAQAELAKAQLDGENKLKIAKLNADNDFRIAALKVKAEDTKAQIEALRDAALQDDSQRHEHAQNALDRYHENQKLDRETELAEVQAENASRRNFAQGEVDHAHASEQAERGHEQSMEAQAAAAEQAESQDDEAGE